MNKKQIKAQKTALITGASEGIGFEFCRLFARDQINLILVARNEQKLRKTSDRLEREFGIKTHIFALDLSVPDAAQVLYQMIKKARLRIDYLINNAGVGYYGQFSDSDLDAITSMLNLNITMLVRLTRLVVLDMLEQGSGRILNVASLAGFQPGGPKAAVYYASKNFVLAFNRALVVELKHTPVTTTAFCPGPVTTAFAEHGGFATTRLYQYFSSEPHQQVAKAYQGFLQGKSSVVPGLVNKLLAIGGEVPPRAIALALNKFLLR